MNGKHVLYRDAKTVLTEESEKFHHKLLCDGLILNLGDGCAFSCVYCYVGPAMSKLDQRLIDDHSATTGSPHTHSDVVIRRRDAIKVLRQQLLNVDGAPKFNDPADTRVIFTSTIVDPVPNKELLKETVEAVLLILEHTHWRIRILSKSALLATLPDSIPAEFHHRLILGFSIGTLDDKLAAAIERGTSSPTRRIKALHQLQDKGIRTFGMLCPSLPQDDYERFSREACEAIRVDRCEHVWAEVLNVRGESMTKTVNALREHGFAAEAERLEEVSGGGRAEQWESYARDTFLAHARNVPAGKLRFLQYVTPETAQWWAERRKDGAVPLGKEAELRLILAPGKSAATKPFPELDDDDIRYQTEREQVVSDGIKASVKAARALWEIHGYRDGLLWRREFRRFEDYCASKWGDSKSNAYRQLKLGEFVSMTKSPNGDSVPLPKSEGQIRGLLDKLPKEHWVDCWSEITGNDDPATLTGAMVEEKARKYARKNKIETKVPRSGAPPNPGDRIDRLIAQLRRAIQTHPRAGEIQGLLLEIANVASTAAAPAATNDTNAG
jgi:DNA repair photolyase